MRSIRGALLAVALALLAVAPVEADGTLPPLPYRYLHPPPALAGQNLPPESGRRSISLVSGRSVAGFVFTRDGQAGLVVRAGALSAPSPASRIVLTLTPVETAGGLPPQYTNDGNAYTVHAVGEPGNRPVTVRHPVAVTLRWPRIPPAIYRYSGGSWSQLCYSDAATFTPSTMSCPTARFGTFVAVTYPVVGRPRAIPVPPQPKSRWASLSHYIPLFAVLLVATIAAFLAYVVTRSRPGRGDQRRQ